MVLTNIISTTNSKMALSPRREHQFDKQKARQFPKWCSRLHESTVFSKHELSCRRYQHFEMVLSPAREHIFFKIGALVQVIIPVLRQHASSTSTVNSYYEMVFSPAWEHRFCQNRCSRAGESHIWKWYSRLHESTCFSKCVLSPRREHHFQ